MVFNSVLKEKVGSLKQICVFQPGARKITTQETKDRNSPFHAVCGCHYPLRGDDRAPTDVSALHMEADLPWPLPQHCPAATHDSVHDVDAFSGDAAL